MSSEKQPANQNEEPNKPKINTYIYIFLGFIFIMLAVFLVFRNLSQDFSSRAQTPEKKAETVVVAKDPLLAEKKKKLLKDTSGDFYLGSQYAPVVVIEYASLSCPHCAHFHEAVVEPLTPNYINKGKVKYVFRDFPLNVSAVAAAKLTHCADPDKYFSFVKVLFKSQEQWAYNANYLTILKSIAKLGGLPEMKFDECQRDKDIEGKIFKTQQDAVDVLGVESTPTVFINGNKYDGKHEYNDVAKYIDNILKGDDGVSPAAPLVTGPDKMAVPAKK